MRFSELNRCKEGIKYIIHIKTFLFPQNMFCFTARRFYISQRGINWSTLLGVSSQTKMTRSSQAFNKWIGFFFFFFFTILLQHLKWWQPKLSATGREMSKKLSFIFFFLRETYIYIARRRKREKNEFPSKKKIKISDWRPDLIGLGFLSIHMEYILLQDYFNTFFRGNLPG